jgi:hypothetical protein
MRVVFGLPLSAILPTYAVREALGAELTSAANQHRIKQLRTHWIVRRRAFRRLAGLVLQSFSGFRSSLAATHILLPQFLARCRNATA